MDALGGLLILIGFAVFGVSFWSFFKPLPTLRLASRRASAIGLALSVASCMLGSSLGGPKSTETIPSADVASTAAAPAEPASEEAASAYDMDRDTFLRRLNATWTELDNPGAFAAQSTSEVEAGENKGGKLTNACASKDVCAIIEENPKGRVTALVLAMGGEGTPSEALRLMALQTSVLRLFEPEADLKDAYQRQVDRLDGNGEVDRVGNSCLLLAAPEGMGIWMTVSRAPCDS